MRHMNVEDALIDAKRFEGDEQEDPSWQQARRVGHLPLTSIGRHAIRRRLKKMRKLLPRVRDGEAGEAVHDLRVATRSLRAALRMLGETPVYDQKQVKSLRRRLRLLTSVLGEARDLDVFLEHVVAFERTHPGSGDGLGVLRATLVKRRKRAGKRLRAELGRKRTRHLLRELRMLTKDGHRQEHAKGGAGNGRQLLVREVAGSALWRQYEELLAFEWTMPDATPDTLHQLRIACKRLRYLLELLDDADDADQHPMLATLTGAQTYLGDLHDDVVALETVEELLKAHSGDVALSTYAAMLANDRDTHCAGVGTIWARVSGESNRLRLARFLAAL